MGCDLVRHLLQEGHDGDQYLIYQYLHRMLSTNVNKTIFRHPSLTHSDLEGTSSLAVTWRVLAWCVLWYGKSIVYNPTMDQQLTECVKRVYQGIHHNDSILAIHCLLTWYIRVTNEIKNMHVVVRLLRHQHASLFYRPLHCCSTFLARCWARTTCAYHRPFHVLGDPLEEDVLRNDRDFHFEVGFPEYDDWDYTPEQEDGYAVSYYDDKIMLRNQDGEDIIVTRWNNVGYNLLFEEIGVFVPHRARFLFYEHFPLETSFSLYTGETFPLLKYLIPPLTKKEKWTPLLPPPLRWRKYQEQDEIIWDNANRFISLLHHPDTFPLLAPHPVHGDFSEYQLR